MTPIASFAAAAASWQNFYLLVGEAAATLVGLMFVAVTFGASLVTEQTSASARAFLDPTFTHFAQILFTACLVVIPTMSPTLLGSILLLVSASRTAALIQVFRTMREAHQVHHDIELSDWASGVVLPLLCFVLLGAAGAGFLAGYAAAFNMLATVTTVLLLIGIFGAWELLVWMAVARSRAEAARTDPAPSNSAPLT